MKHKLKYLVIHCTATPEGREVTGDDIKRWHCSPVSEGGRGWKQVGYTDFIKLDGTIERLVPNNEDAWCDPWEITNGVSGINDVSRHIVYAGGLDKKGNPKDTRTKAQLEAMKQYVLDFMQRFPDVEIKGHIDFANKDCPCFDVQKWIDEIPENK